MNQLSDVARNYPASLIRQMFELANRYENVIRLTVGEPNFETPEHIKRAAQQALDENHTHYVSNAGLIELRQAIADKLARNFGRPCTSDQVMVAFGGMEAIFLGAGSDDQPGRRSDRYGPCIPELLGADRDSRRQSCQGPGLRGKWL